MSIASDYVQEIADLEAELRDSEKENAQLRRELADARHVLWRIMSWAERKLGEIDRLEETHTKSGEQK